MDEDLLALYEDIKGEYNVGSFDEFKTYISDEGNAQAFYEGVVEPNYNVSSFDEFKATYISPSSPMSEKKNFDSESVSEDGSLEPQESVETDFLDYTQAVNAPMMQDAEQISTADAPQTIEELQEKIQDPGAFNRQPEMYYIGSEQVDVNHPDKATRVANQKRVLNMPIPSVESLTIRGMGISEAVSKHSAAVNKRAELAARYKRERLEESGIKEQPTFQEVLDGARPTVELPENFYDIASTPLEERSEDDLFAAEIIYNERAKANNRKQKKEAGFIEVNGELMDPEALDEGFGFDAALNTLTFSGDEGSLSKDGVTLRNESDMRSLLENKFKQYGFTVSEDVVGQDFIVITGPDGSEKRFSLGGAGSAKLQASAIKRFINNSYANAGFTLEQQAEQAGKMVSDTDLVGIDDLSPEKIMNGRSKYVTAETEKLFQDREKLEKVGTMLTAKSQDIKNTEKDINDLLYYNDKFQSRDGSISFRNSEVQKEYDRLTELYLKQGKDIRDLAGAGGSLENDFNKKAKDLEYYAGERALMLANAWDIDDIPAFTAGEFMRGIGSVVSGYTRLGHDLYSNINNIFYNEDDEEYITDKERKQFKQGLSMTSEMRGMFDMNKETEQAIRESGGIITEGLFGLAGSLPAMFTGPASIPSFAAMSIDAVSSEMEKIPEFANISENEKLLLTIPIGVTVGVLERVGFRNALNNSSLVSRITINALKKFGAQNLAKAGTKKTFQEIVERSALSSIKKAGILTLSSAASEFETGAAQELAEVYAKEIYDVAKDNNFFDQAIDLQEGEMWNWNLTKQVLRAGAAEAVGGFVMGMPNAISRATVGEKLPQVSDMGFDLFRLLNNSKNVDKTIASQKANWYAKVGVKENPETGEVYTKKEVDDMFNLYEDVIGQSKQIKEEYGAEYQKKILQKLIQKKTVRGRD